MEKFTTVGHGLLQANRDISQRERCYCELRDFLVKGFYIIESKSVLCTDTFILKDLNSQETMEVVFTCKFNSFLKNSEHFCLPDVDSLDSVCFKSSKNNEKIEVFNYQVKNEEQIGTNILFRLYKELKNAVANDDKEFIRIKFL